MCLQILDLTPDHVEKVTLGKGEHRGFEWQVVHNGKGVRCGYLRVLSGHPWFGKKMGEIVADAPGGLNFGQAGASCITHDGKAEWWVGFDCGHSWDARDPELPFYEGDHPEIVALRERMLDLEAKLHAIESEYRGFGFRSHFWTQAEVVEACQSLAEQADEALKEALHG